MPLFSTIEQIAGYVTISNANSNSSLPKQRLAEDEFIKPVIGDVLFAGLQDQVTTGPVTQVDLLDKVRLPLAFLAYYKELPLIHTIITDSGLRNVTNDKIQGAYRYQYENVLQHLENEGLAGLERLFEFLMANQGDYTDWVSSTAYARLNKNLIKTGIDFTKYYYLFQPNRTFFALQPVMQEVEDLFIKSIMGDTFFTYLKNVADPSDEEKIVIDLLKKAIANFTIFKAISKLSVRVRPEGFTVMIGTLDRSPQGEANASMLQLELLHQETYKDGNSYLDRAMVYLNANASVSVFADYFTSSYYLDPLAEKPCDINYHMRGLYAF